MLTIYVSSHSHQVTTASGQTMTVRGMFVREVGGFVSLFDFKPPSQLEDVRVVLVRKFLRNKVLQLPTDLKLAIIRFLVEYHARINMDFDCYAFANLVKGVKVHKVPYMLAFWDKFRKPWRMTPGTVLFYCSGETHFHHAAIYIGAGLYISVYGAGGDLETASHSDMMRDFRAQKAYLAKPRKAPL